MRPKVAVLVLNYNGVGWLKLCLPSLFRTEFENLEIWVIDNGSSDGSVDFVRTTYPNVKILRFEQNLGFAEAYNRAVKPLQTDYVILLNNDVAILDAGWIDRLLETARADNRIAGVQCKLVSMNEQTSLDSVGGMGIKYWLGFTDIGKLQPDMGQYDYPPVTPFYVCAAGALINRRAFLDVGGFDSAFFAYVEDADLSWRLRLAGYLIAYQPAARVAHFWQGSPNQSVGWRTYMQRRNLLRTIIKNCGSATIWWALRNYTLHNILLALAFISREPQRSVAVVRAWAWNIINLADTYRERVIIQSRRNTPEKTIMQSMYPPIPYRPLRNDRLHHVLGIIFKATHDQSCNITGSLQTMAPRRQLTISAGLAAGYTCLP
jgi:hypothetical protein